MTHHLLAIIVGAPALAAAVLLFIPNSAKLAVRLTSLAGAAVALAGSVWVALTYDMVQKGFQRGESWPIVPSLDLYPTFDYYFVSGGSLWSLNFDVKYRPPTVYQAWYVGGGLNWSHASSGGVSGSDTNLNLFTGLEGRRGRTRPYVEGKFILGNGSSFQIVGGLSWR